MITCMSDILCVTNRVLCKEDFIVRIEKIASAHPSGIILREKDLSEKEYRNLAKTVLEICHKHGVPCILHSFTDVASELNCNALHLPLDILRTLSAEDKKMFKTLGASCHSADDAVEAQKLGCTYITAGHIFDTDCKKGVAGRGLGFLREICQSVNIPVYAIGGINSENISQVINAGASGACIMSGTMVCEDVQKYFSAFEEN